jgi:hypothetical protein
MAYVTSNRFKGFISPDGIASVTSTFTTFSLNAPNMGIAYQIIMPEAATITRVMLYCTAVAASTSSPTVCLEGIDLANGQPDNISLSGASVNIPNSSGFLTITLTTPYTASVGSTFYIVIRWANPTSEVQIFGAARRLTASGSPLVLTRASNASTFTKFTTTNGFPQAIVGSSTKWYGWSCLIAARASGAVQANPVYVGFYFQTPALFPEVLLKSVHSVTAMPTNELTDFVIFNSAGTTLYSSVYDNDTVGTGVMTEFIVANGIWLTPSTKYYVMFRSTTPAATKYIFRNLVNGPAVVSDFTNGMQWGVSRYSGGTFIDDDTAIPAAVLEICQMRYDQTGGTPVYSLPASFNQFSG